MAIKKLNFSFEVPITALLSLIATGNAGLKIDVLGDDKSHPIGKLLNGAHPAMKLLEGPKKPGIGSPGKPRARGKDENGHTITAYDAILKTLGARSDHTMPLADLRPLVAGLGLSPGSANSQINLLRQRGLAKRVGEGMYQLTKPGITECEKRGFKVVGKNRKPPDKKKKAAAAVEAPVAAEGDHG